ncbi:calcium-translocating P-type ATPase, PMCA-type [Deltaproteobacteria bacterium TL4]
MNPQTVKNHQGLSPVEVEASRQKHGANVLTPPEREPWWKLYLEKFDDPVIRILLIAAFMAIGVGILDGHYVEGLGIVVAIALATALAFLNEFKAGREFDILNQVNDEVPIKVIREARYLNIPRKDLVVADLLLIEAGEEIPGDGEVQEAVSLQVDESRLTGESLPVHKMPVSEISTSVRHETAYPQNKVLRGTIVKDGHAMIQVTAVGDASEIGTAARAASEETDEPTPLDKQLNKLSQIIGVIGFSVAALIYVALVFQGVLLGELILTLQQWTFTGILTVSILLAIIRVWLPIVYDGVELAGKSAQPPSWLENDTWQGWLKSLLGGGVVFIGALAAGYGLGLVPSVPQDWLPPHVGTEFLKYFMISVTIIVVAVPEGLAMSVTLSLAYSMRKMTASNNLVRHLHACETIGAATVICSDKTGTLTQNEMQVHETHFPCFSKQVLTAETSSPPEQLICEAICCNTSANLSRTEGEATLALGNPTEGSLLLWLEQQRIDYEQHRNRFSILQQWTFSTERKYMGTLGKSSIFQKNVLHIKGAPEIVMDLCDTILTDQGVQPIAAFQKDLLQMLKNYQSRGMRTLAFAYKNEAVPPEDETLETVAHDLVWLGFVAIADPVRAEVPGAIQSCQHAGIMVKIVTGDIAETAKEIARQIGLGKPEDPPECYLTGTEFGAMDDNQARKAVLKMKVLARARPLDKLRLVRLLQQENHVVAVTGDGTNDAPALNHANVGLAMGKTGTAVAKEASDIILLDDSFASIVNAVMWGRSLYENIQRFVLFQLTINVAALGIALMGPFIGVKLPLTVIQMLWVNLIMDTFAALALATEPPHQNVMDRPPRNPDDFIITLTMAKQIGITALGFLVFFVGLLFYFQKDGQVDDYELSVFFTLFVLLQFWNLFNAKCLGQNHSAFSGILENKAFLLIAAVIFVGQVLIVQLGGSMFRTIPLSLTDWGLITLTSSVVLWIGELSRFLIKKQA